MCFSATMRKPLRSKRAMISPVSPRPKASGFTRMRVRSMWVAPGWRFLAGGDGSRAGVVALRSRCMRWAIARRRGGGAGGAGPLADHVSVNGPNPRAGLAQLGRLVPFDNMGDETDHTPTRGLAQTRRVARYVDIADTTDQTPPPLSANRARPDDRHNCERSARGAGQ